MGWQENAIMYWSPDEGTTWHRISDHNRAPLGISVERIERKVRTVDGTMRRYTVSKKRSFNVSWSMFPSKNGSTHNGRTGLGTVDNGWAGEDIEDFHNSVDGAFLIKLREGTDDAKAIGAITEQYRVMITDFSKDIEKRGIVDFWNLDITLEEV